MKKQIKISICTPTYNRGNLLYKLYESLKQQSFQDFEWIIVDDGSIDNTKELIRNFKEEKNFSIKYIYKNNGGKHTAINKGVESADGELFWIIDSDDYIVLNALEIVWNVWSSIKDKTNYAGVAGLRGYNRKSIIGTAAKENYLNTDILSYRYKYNITGDKSEIYVTELLKKYPFPEFEGERYLTEAVVWNRIAHDGFKLRWFNEIIYICEYLDGGLTNTSDKNIMKSWKGTTLYYKEFLAYKEIPIKYKIVHGIKAYNHYCYEKGVGINGILMITRNPIYILISYLMYIGKCAKRKLRLIVK